MSDQNITELPIKTNSGVASTDYMLGIDSAEGYQILVRDVAKYIVENYNGSTILGSAQTVKSAFDALSGNLTNNIVFSATTPSALDTISQSMPSVSYYHRRVTITTTDANLGAYGGDLIGYKHNDNYEWQEFHSTATHKIRYKTNGTWGEWKQVPTRDEVNALNSNMTKTYTGSVSFSELDPIRPNDSNGFGAWIDAMISDNIASFEKNKLHNVCGISNSILYGATFFKASDTYYCGILFSYHANCRNTLWFFKNMNGSHMLRPLAMPIS